MNSTTVANWSPAILCHDFLYTSDTTLFSAMHSKKLSSCLFTADQQPSNPKAAVFQSSKSFFMYQQPAIEVYSTSEEEFRL